MKTIKIAITKGRIAKVAIDMLKEMGIHFKEEDLKSRKLMIKDVTEQYELILAKGFDVATYVEKGVADVGVVGKDCLMEQYSDVYELVDLQFGKCTMCVCGFQGEVLKPNKKIIVASKYPETAKQYFEAQGLHAEIIKLNGSVEIAPLIHLSDVIVDIVETGKTLSENNLHILHEIAPISTRLIVNKVSLKTRPEISDKIIPACEVFVQKRSK